VVASRDDPKGRARTIVGHGPFAEGVRVSSFAEGRICYREWGRRNGRLGETHSLDDRYDDHIASVRREAYGRATEEEAAR
jgi:hypothetical protein